MRFLLPLLLLGCLCAQPRDILSSVRNDEVLIHRDHWGIPHIYGKSDRAVAFGFGYAQAEDHLEDMYRLFLKARGELSKVDGERALSQDVTERTLLATEIIEQSLDRLPAGVREYNQAFADGINHYVETHARERLSWYWKLGFRDILVYMKFIELRNGLGAVQLKMRRMRGAAGEPDTGSNAWAIAKSRSANGAVMLLADPHLSWKGDWQWYEAHLKCPQFDAAGATLFGISYIALGHNADVAWTTTNNAADTVDLYEEKIDPKDPDRYLDSDGAWKRMEVRTFTFDVRQPDGTFKKIQRSVRYTRRGPYLPVAGGRSYSVAIAGWREGMERLAAVTKMAAARNVSEFKAAWKIYMPDKWNMVCADRSGNIYTLSGGMFPRRSLKYDWRRPLPGWEKDAQWNGLVPFEELPQFENPPNGLIVQCNNSVYSAAQPPPLDPAKYLPYLAPPGVVPPRDSRAARVYELFGEGKKITWQQHVQAALDVRAMTADGLVRFLVAALESAGNLDPDLKEMHSILKSWDFMAALDNRAVPILSHFLRVAKSSGFNWQRSRPADGVAILKNVAGAMRTLYGSVSVPMSRVQVLERGAKEFPVAGVGNTSALNPFTSLFMSGTNSYRNGKWYANQGSSWLMVVAFGTPLKTLSVTPLGQSNNPQSPHYTDQTALFSKREPKPFAYSDTDVLGATERSYRLQVAQAR